ncbi:MAG TPA: hypothetical protein VLC74_08270 [Rhizomicrobium sp.]|nr:hypothetical protein [Rhizomicrobium sp.]
MSRSPRPAWIVLALAAPLLSACIGTTALSQLEQARPLGGPFSQALFRNYAALAHSFGAVGTPTSGTPFDAAESLQLGSMSADVADIANAYAEKAILTSQGEEILPEPPDPNIGNSEAVRLQLLRDLGQGRDSAPNDAARAQADYDCWVMNARSDELRRAAEQCRRSLSYSLGQLERNLAAQPQQARPTAQTPSG